MLGRGSASGGARGTLYRAVGGVGGGAQVPSLDDVLGVEDARDAPNNVGLKMLLRVRTDAEKAL